MIAPNYGPDDEGDARGGDIVRTENPIAMEGGRTSRRNLLLGSAGLAAAACTPAARSAGTTTTALSGKSAKKQGRKDMGTIITKDGTELYYKDWGAGRPIVFSHGWPLSSDSWEGQML